MNKTMTQSKVCRPAAAAAVLLLAAGTGMFAIAADWAFGYRPIQAHMAVYSGGLGDPAPPTGQEAKVSFHVQGAAARELFDRMGPDAKDVCGADATTRVRRRDQLECIRYSASNHSCYFGFDLKTGKSIGGSIC
ncbi:hypothetical protein [Paracidovorax sp. MALMAid1276]|uniref:hypothetical protein n=1 Tax=Paracidovorax sp. MALMAid1276 TaxID=3411631 RepID=UPI003B9A3BF1